MAHVNEGSAGHLNIIGWTGDYADADNFLGTFFQSANPQFGLTRRGAHGVIAKLLDRAEAETRPARRVALYKRIAKLVSDFVPAVPYAHSRPGVGVERRVAGYRASPVGTESFYGVTIGGQ